VRYKFSLLKNIGEKADFGGFSCFGIEAVVYGGRAGEFQQYYFRISDDWNSDI
jgi:hypothetical protein